MEKEMTEEVGSVVAGYVSYGLIALVGRVLLDVNGICDEHGNNRYDMNPAAKNTYGGTYEIHALILNRVQTGLQDFM